MQVTYGLGFYQRKFIFAIIFLSFLTLLCFCNIFGNEFVWDDHEFIVENPLIRSLSFLPQALKESVVNLYRPLRSALYILSYALFQDLSLGYHIVGLGLHLLCVLVLFALLIQLGFPFLTALLGGALFAVLPVHTESVTFITASYDLLGPLFFLLSFTFFILKGKKQIFSWLFFGLALLSSEMTITLPLLLFAYLILIQKDSFLSSFGRVVPFLLLSLSYLFLRFVILDIGARDTQYLGGSALVTFLTMPRVGLEYLRLLFWPLPLLADYRHFDLIQSPIQPGFLISIGVLLGLSLLLFIKRQNWKWSAFAWVWLWVALLPVSNLLPMGNVMAERYLYLPSIALCFVLNDFFTRWEKKRGIALCSLLILFSGLTFVRNFDWKNEITLWTKTALQAPGSFVAHNNLGSHYLTKGLYNSSFDEISHALRLKPDFVDAYTNLGALFEKRKMWEQAQKAYEKAIQLNPNHAAAHCNLGNIYLKLGDRRKAMELYQRSKEINSLFYIAYYNIGNIRFEEGDLVEAETQYQKALSIQPYFVNAHFNLSLLHAKLGKRDLAIEEMKKVIELVPHDLVAKKTLRNLLAKPAASYPYATTPQEERQ